MSNYSVVKLTYKDEAGKEYMRLCRSINEAKDAIKLYRASNNHVYHSFRIKVVKYK